MISVYSLTFTFYFKEYFQLARVEYFRWQGTESNNGRGHLLNLYDFRVISHFALNGGFTDPDLDYALVSSHGLVVCES